MDFGGLNDRSKFLSGFLAASLHLKRCSGNKIDFRIREFQNIPSYHFSNRFEPDYHLHYDSFIEGIIYY